jgi:type IV secretory pathway TraG/TraD family ATPase VirD4
LAGLLKELESANTFEASVIARNLNKIVESGNDYYNKISSSLRVALMELTTGNTGQILGNVRGNDVIERLESGKGVILVAQVGSLLTNRTAFTISKVLLSMLKSFTGRTFASGKTLNPPLSVYLDEAQNVLFHGFEDLVAKGGGANLLVHGFSQSVNQIYAAMGDETRGRSILDNINTKIFMRSPDNDTAEYVAEHFGTVKRFSSILNVGGTPNMREAEENLVKPQHLLSLQSQEFYMLTYDGRYKGLTTNVAESKLKVEYPSAGVG